MMDISDGISSEILHYLQTKRTWLQVLYEEKLPIADLTRQAAFKFGLDPTVCALNGGEDYELIFTLKQEDHDKIILNEEISVIGYMTEKEEGANSFQKAEIHLILRHKAGMLLPPKFAGKGNLNSTCFIIN
jgi:thiamine-monophosphate kinase